MAISHKTLVPAGLAVVFLMGCGGEAAKTPRVLEATTLRFSIPEELGSPQRPLVEFDHAVHTRALMDEGCGACHASDEKQRVLPWLKGQERVKSLDDLMENAHGICITCHQERIDRGMESGPVTCGECHRERPPAVSVRRELRWDYSMHYRHVAAVGDDCGTCHHVYDERSRKLVYRKGTESSCDDCHTTRAKDRPLSHRDASHLACINCHLEYDQKSKPAGPVLCAGCHDPRSQEEFERVVDPPRLERGQPDLTWIHTQGAQSKLVPFDHRGHEPLADSCSGCHHKTLQACGDCHTLLGSEKGGQVTLEQAHHSAASRYSCVGCHRARIENTPGCTSCHFMIPASRTGQRCEVCHSGPLPENAEDPPALAPVELAALPETSEDFPEVVRIETLSDQYLPSRLPHRLIAAHLDAEVRNSKLAVRFHGQTATLCAGCHHQSPMGTRPPACRSCHTIEAASHQDQPGLLAAYHRQCIGCHQQMELVQGCTDCHDEASGGTRP